MVFLISYEANDVTLVIYNKWTLLCIICVIKELPPFKRSILDNFFST